MSVDHLLIRQTKLRKTIRCLNCWENFAPQDVLWISEHMDLMGDVLLGGDYKRRFCGVRYSVHGDAIDVRGSVCTEVACPKCHLPIPRVLLSHRPLFCSILGIPSCGKSYFLGSMTYKIRKLLPEKFMLDFTDTDYVSNGVLGDYEQALFLQPNPDKLKRLGDLIPKTQLEGQLYNQVIRGHQTVLYPRPFSFLLSPMESSPLASKKEMFTRTVCLYDNAGEHFLPGQDSSITPATRHLSVSDFMMFLFDPLQDPRFVEALAKSSSEPERYQKQIERFKKPVRQEFILRECAERVRKYRRAADVAGENIPLIIVITKLDEWKQLIPSLIQEEMVTSSSNGKGNRLRTDLIEKNSKQIEVMLKTLVPELVVAANAFSDHVIYVPVSALGVQPKVDSEGVAYIKPRDIKPEGIEVPFLYGLSQVTKGFIPVKKTS